MSDPTGAAPIGEAARALGGEEPLRLLTQLVATAPVNLEDPGHQRWEKPNYLRAADTIVRAARAAGLATRIYDPLVAGNAGGNLRGINRPNVIVDLDVGAEETVLILAHYDVVPVPAEQLARWRSPPHTLTYRADHRLYGRGSNDDLGSGVVTSLTALRHLADAKDLSRNVRLLVCCDEETGGQGGIEAIREHDEHRAEEDPERILRADVALIPDGGPEVTAGSSGIAFLEGSFERPVPLADALAYGRALVDLHEVARGWRSVYRSPDWPDRHAPEPVITGRASLTKFDVGEVLSDPDGVGLLAAHAETDAANQIARAVTLVFGGPAPALEALPAKLSGLVPAPFRLETAGATALPLAPGTRALQVVGTAAHGGYPHRGHNPVPVAIDLLRHAVDRRLIDAHAVGVTSFTVDLRLTPEMELDTALAAAQGHVREWIQSHSPLAVIAAPPERCRPGYALPVDDPAAQRLVRILHETLGAKGVVGEYGGTDASALRGLRTPRGAALPALVFGSMDPVANIHDAEESLDPRLFAGVVTTIERFVREP